MAKRFCSRCKKNFKFLYNGYCEQCLSEIVKTGTSSFFVEFDKNVLIPTKKVKRGENEL